MSDAAPWVLVALVAVAVLVALAYRRWGSLGAAVASLGTLALWLAAAVGLARIARRPRGRAPSTHPGVHRAQDAHRARARDALRDAERAREAAVRIAADVDTAGDAEALVEHLVRRSEGNA